LTIFARASRYEVTFPRALVSHPLCGPMFPGVSLIAPRHAMRTHLKARAPLGFDGGDRSGSLSVCTYIGEEEIKFVSKNKCVQSDVFELSAPRGSPIPFV
jgi:hypothetical protein